MKKFSCLLGFCLLVCSAGFAQGGSVMHKPVMVEMKDAKGASVGM